MGFGGKSDSGSSVQYVQPEQQTVDYEALMAPMYETMAAQSAQNNELMGAMMSSNIVTPSVSDLSIDLDYDAENQALQDKINKQITDADVKRRGVLGTILSDIDDDDDPSTVTSSLLSGS